MALCVRPELLNDRGYGGAAVSDNGSYRVRSLVSTLNAPEGQIQRKLRIVPGLRALPERMLRIVKAGDPPLV